MEMLIYRLRCFLHYSTDSKLSEAEGLAVLGGGVCPDRGFFTFNR